MLFAQDGKILSKQLIDLRDTPIWSKIAPNDSLNTEYAHLEKLNVYTITYESDSLAVRGVLMEPKQAGKYPVVIFNRGGNRDVGRLTVGTLVMYTSKLAAAGYIVIGSNYRKADEFGGEEINDVLCLSETIKAIEKADTNRVGMFGWSRGGMMTYLALQKTDIIKTAVIGNGPTDLFGTIADRPIMETNVISECVPNYWANKEIELKKRSAIYWPDELSKSTSLLILCGLEDKRVNPNQAIRMANLLEELEYDFELRTFETDHFFSDKKQELNALLLEWFDSKLK